VLLWGLGFSHKYAVNCRRKKRGIRNIVKKYVMEKNGHLLVFSSGKITLLSKEYRNGD
jgi:hypothetical protein